MKGNNSGPHLVNVHKGLKIEDPDALLKERFKLLSEDFHGHIEAEIAGRLEIQAARTDGRRHQNVPSPGAVLRDLRSLAVDGGDLFSKPHAVQRGPVS